MSNAETVGKQLVAMCKEGNFMGAARELYGDDIVSVEAAETPSGGRELRGKQAVLGKATWWEANHEVHAATTTGPFPHGDDRFAVIFDLDVTFKPEQRRNQMQEVAVYTVANGKIVREEFYYKR
jgi:hypothetical protein